MRPTKNELVLRSSIKFSKADLNSSTLFTEISQNSDSIGGIIRKGQLGWLARGPLLEVFSLRNGNKISSFRFDVTTSFRRCFITCVSEIEAPNLNYCLLAVGIQFGDNPGGMVSIYSVQESKVLHSIETSEKVTCCHIINANVAERTVLQVFQGCLAIGTDVGKVILLDLHLHKCVQMLVEMKTSDMDFFLTPCHVVLSTMDLDHIREHFRHSRRENIGFGIQLEVVDNSDLVLSLQTLVPLLSLAVGLEDGRMLLYDLNDLQAFHVTYPPEDMSPLVQLTYIEPPDDPRACIYIWAFHENRRSSIAVMHSVMYDRKVLDDEDDDDGFCIFEGFQACSVRLMLPMFEHGSIPVSCQSIMKLPTHDSEETISLCLLAWKSRKTSEILIFDINQWYKEQMPSIGDWRDNLSYLASFPMKESELLDVWLDGRTIAPFNSIHRPEEHFFPISLTFDLVAFQDSESMNFHWSGLQNRVLSMLNMAGPSALLEPSVYYHEIAKASLISQNSSDYGFSSNVSLSLQRDVLLSVALENNCFNLLKECAKCWADGSHLGRKREESLSLSTITTWIWKRAESIKERCNMLCVSLFDHSGLRIDRRSQVELSYCSRQLKLLADLMKIVLTKCSEYIPEEVNNTLTTQYNSINMASEYQEVLQWFLNVGLLPEAMTDYKGIRSHLDSSYDSRTPLVPYPYKALRNYYMSQRLKFKKINSGLLSPRTQSCRILYIDSFIEHECNPNAMHEQWLESGGNGLYPPPSLQAMLRVLLVADVPVEKKYVLFVYFFLDLSMALEDDRYSEVVQNFMKFPSVFKISSSTIKTVQAFWNLDHGQFEAALEDIISPFLHDQKLLQWQKELLIEALLVHHVSQLALRALQAPGPPISSLLELKTLLANDMVAEAFHLQRSKNDPDLFRHFLNGCFYLGKLGALLDLALTEDEDKILEEFLRDCKTAKTENIRFIHLLQRSKYIDAIQQLDELSRSKYSQNSVDLETPNLVLAAYNITMTPATKQLSEVYYGIRNRLKAKKPEAQKLDTLSSYLLGSNANDIADGIYHSSIMSTDEITNYWDEQIQQETKRLLHPANVPFIRRPQIEAFTGYQGESAICYPEAYKGTQKRRLDKSDASDKQFEQDSNENPRKRPRINDSLSGIRTAQPINISLLTKFKNRQGNKQSAKDEASMSSMNQSQYERDMSITSLSTPIVKSRRQALDSRDDSPSDTSEFNKGDRVGTPHSILKVRNVASNGVSSPIRKGAESTPRRSVSPKELEVNEYVDEEKSIRFELPSGNVTANSSLQTSRESLEMSQRVPSTSIASVMIDEKSDAEKIQRIESASPRKAIRSTDASLISASGDEDFFSPQESRDNSMKKTNTVTEEIEDQVDKDRTVTESKLVEEVLYKSRILEGPKPRKPLERSSRSRSKTPDIPVSPARKSTRLLEKSKTQFSENQVVQSSVELSKQTSSKPLGRFVLESNAKKVSSSVSSENYIQMLDKGRVLAQSTEIYESKTIVVRGEPHESHKLSEFTTLENEDNLTDLWNLSTKPSTSFNVSETQNIDCDNCEIMEDSSGTLTTTAEMTTFDITMEELSPPKSESLNITSKIEGRRSYKAGNDSFVEAKSLPFNLAEQQTGELYQQYQAGYQKSIEIESREAHNDQIIVEGIGADSYTERNDENLASDVLYDEKQQELKDTHIDTNETPREDAEGEETGVESSDQVISDDDEEDEVRTGIRETKGSDNESESDSSDVISISSGNDTTPTQGQATTTNESQTNTSTEDEQDDIKLLYGDLDVDRPSSRVQSITSSDSKNSSPIPISDAALSSEKNLTVEDNAIQRSTVASVSSQVFTFNSPDASMTLLDSGIGSVASSGMTLNVLTGEYENIDEDGTEKKNAALQVDRERIEVTFTAVMEAENENASEEVVDSAINANVSKSSTLGHNVESTQIRVESGESDENLGNEEEKFAFEVGETKAEMDNNSNERTSDSVISEAIENETGLNTTVNQHIQQSSQSRAEQNATPSTLRRTSISQSRAHSIEKTTDDIRLNISDDESDKVGHEAIDGDEKNTKTPVKRAVEIDSATNSGRILRSARHRSTSIDRNKSEDIVVDSPSIAQRLLRATSVPATDSAETPTRSRLRKRSNSTDNPSTPTRILTRRRSILLDKIEENSVLDSPRRSARKRVTAVTELEDLPQTPSSMVKRTRKASTSSVDTPDQVTTPRSVAGRKGILSEDNIQTPQRAARRTSVSKDIQKSTPEVSENVTKGRRSKKSSTPETEKSYETTETPESDTIEDSPDNKAMTGKSGVRKLFSKSSANKSVYEDKSEADSSLENVDTLDYGTSRRLTRHQQNVLEKSAAVAKKMEVMPKKVIRRRGSKMDESPIKKGDISETESVISSRSKYSTTSAEYRRITRSASALQDDVDDVVSVASSSRSKKSAKNNKMAKATSSKDKSLDAIVEEDQENVKKNSSHDSDDDGGSTHSATFKDLTKKKGRSRKTLK